MTTTNSTLIDDLTSDLDFLAADTARYASADQVQSTSDRLLPSDTEDPPIHLAIEHNLALREQLRILEIENVNHRKSIEQRDTRSTTAPQSRDGHDVPGAASNLVCSSSPTQAAATTLKKPGLVSIILCD